MAIRRRSIEIRATTIAKVMAGETRCEYGVWFNIHYTNFRKVSRDLEEWKKKHRLAVLQKKAYLEAQGSKVTMEGQHRFRLPMEGVTLVGEPDLVCRDEISTIYEIKTGLKRDSDRLQTMIYLYAIPLA